MAMHTFGRALRSEQSLQGLRQRLETFEQHKSEQIGSLSEADGKICDLHCLLGEVERDRRGSQHHFEQTEQERANLAEVMKEALAQAESLREQVALIDREQRVLGQLTVRAANEDAAQRACLEQVKAEVQTKTAELATSQVVEQELLAELEQSQAYLRAQHAEMRHACWTESRRHETVELCKREESSASAEAMEAARERETTQSTSDVLTQGTGELREHLDLLKRAVVECPGMADDIVNAGRDEVPLRAQLAEAQQKWEALRTDLGGSELQEQRLQVELNEFQQQDGELAEQLASVQRRVEDLTGRHDDFERSEYGPTRSRYQEAEAASQDQAQRLRAELGELSEDVSRLSQSVSEQEQEMQTLRGSLEEQETANRDASSRIATLKEENKARARRRGELEQEIAEQRKKGGCSVC